MLSRLLATITLLTGKVVICGGIQLQKRIQRSAISWRWFCNHDLYVSAPEKMLHTFSAAEL